MPPGLFDYPIHHLTVIFQSLVIITLLLYLMQKTPPLCEESATALAGELKISHVLIAFAGIGVLFAMYTAGMAVLRTLGVRIDPPPLLISRKIMLIPSFLTCMAAATMEEFFFRGYAWFRIRRDGGSPVSGLIFISILFAGGHLYEGVPAAVFAFASGLFLGTLILKRFSLFSLSAAHGIFNFVMILLSYLQQSA